MIAVLDHAPTKAIDYSMIANGIRAFLISAPDSMPDKVPYYQVDDDYPRSEFNAGSYKMRCLATRECIAALADRIAKHGVKEKKQRDFTLRSAHGQEYDEWLNPIMMENGGKYKYVDLYVDEKQLEGEFIVAKFNKAGNGYVIFACGSGKPLKVSYAKNVSEALLHTIEAINKAGSWEKVSSVIAESRIEHAKRLQEAGL